MDAFFRELQSKLTKKSKHQPGENSCVLWTGNVSYSGYGLQSVKWPVEDRKLEKAHRVALMVERGLTMSQFRDIEGEVSHLCNNRLCVNTAHLVIEQHCNNQERIHCFLQGCCSNAHSPLCLI